MSGDGGGYFRKSRDGGVGYGDLRCVGIEGLGEGGEAGAADDSSGGWFDGTGLKLGKDVGRGEAVGDVGCVEFALGPGSRHFSI